MKHPRHIAKRIGARLLAAALCVPIAGAHADDAGFESAVELDRLHIEAKRQLDLLTTLGEIGRILDELRRHGEPMLALVDGDLPVEARWRAAFLGAPALPSRDEELIALRNEIEVLKAVVQAMRVAPDGTFEVPEAGPPDSGPEVVEAEPEAPLGPWTPDAAAVRYAQLADAGIRPAVWLEGRTAGRRLSLGETVILEGRAIRLRDLSRRRDGRIGILFEVDGDPLPLVW